MIFTNEISKQRRIEILRSHAIYSVVKNNRPELIHKSKKYGWTSGGAISARIRIRRGNPGPKLPKRGRKSFVPTKTRTQSKLLVAKGRLQSKYSLTVKGIYLLTQNSMYSIFEAVLQR